MSRDLEGQLAGDCAQFAGVVGRLRAAPQVRCGAGFTASVMARIADGERRRRLFARGWWAAAAAVVVVALHLFISAGADGASGVRRLAAMQRADGTFTGSSAASYAQAYAVQALAACNDPALRARLESAVAAIVRAQSAEGGWACARMSAENVAALAAAEAAGVASARVPYLKGLRYLRVNGIPEVPSERLAAEASRAIRGLDRTSDFAAALAI